MKKYLGTLLLITAITLISCNKLLEKPIGSDITEADIFSTRNNAMTYLAETYRQIIPFGFPYFNSNAVYRMDRSTLSGTCDEANYAIGFAPASEQNIAGLLPSSIRLSLDVYTQNYIGIRYAWKFIENVDQVKDMSQAEKARMQAECKTLIALRYAHLLKNYGGVSLVKQSLSLEDDIKIPRSSVAETVSYILALCDEAVPNLLNVHDAASTGRVTVGVAKAVKAEALLFAASPLFNTASPYLSSTQPGLVSYGNYDANRWKLAADAAKDVLDWAAANGIALINTGNPFVDFGNATSAMNNQEVLLSYQGGNVNQNGYTNWYIPTLGAFNEGNALTFNFLPLFYRSNGTNQVWPTANDAARPFSEYNTKMEEMEPRFKSTFWKYGAAAWNNPTLSRFVWNFNASIDPNIAGAAKVIKFTYNYQGGTNVNFAQDWIVYRLSEFYLDYAEALNEFSANDPLAYAALNTIRTRGGLPAIATSDVNYNTQEKLRQLIRRERAIELYAEEHRPYDVRRWRIAHEPGINGGAFYSFAYTKNAASTAYLTYQVRQFETRYWTDKMYLCPFPQVEVNKGYLIQNPGY